MSRPMRFEDIYGHRGLVNLIKARINEATFPHFIILYGEEGLGKTSLARLIALALTCESDTKPCYECESCKQNQKLVIENGKDSSNVFLYRMSIEGGKDVAKDMLTHINSCMGSDVKVFIADEAQRMSSVAQDVLLHDTEHLPAKVFVIMCTTDITSISKTLLSRAVKFYLPHLTREAMVSLLLKSIRQRGLRFPDASQAASLIAEVSERKPREALSVLEGFGYNRDVSYTELSTTLQLNDALQFKELLESFTSGVTSGMSKIFDLDITHQTQPQLCRYISECIKYQNNIPVYIYDVTRDICRDVPTNILVHFLYYVSNIKNFDALSLMSAYLLAHPNGAAIGRHNTDTIGNELNYINKNIHYTQSTAGSKSKHKPSASELLQNGSYVEEGDD